MDRYDDRVRAALEVVPRRDILSAIGMNSTSNNLTRLAGPALAGVVIAR